MRDEEAQKLEASFGRRSSSFSGGASGVSSEKQGFGLGRDSYKLWALAALIFLAVCSLYTASVTLKWSAAALKHDFDPSISGDHDILDMDERTKLVKLMWNVYTQNNIARLSNFWRDAFGAAYQELTSDIQDVREEAFLEIAKMSFKSRGVHHSTPRALRSQVRLDISVRKTMKL